MPCACCGSPASIAGEALSSRSWAPLPVHLCREQTKAFLRSSTQLPHSTAGCKATLVKSPSPVAETIRASIFFGADEVYSVTFPGPWSFCEGCSVAVPASGSSAMQAFESVAAFTARALRIDRGIDRLWLRVNQDQSGMHGPQAARTSVPATSACTSYLEPGMKRRRPRPRCEVA